MIWTQIYAINCEGQHMGATEDSRLGIWGKKRKNKRIFLSKDKEVITTLWKTVWANWAFISVTLQRTG